MLFPASVTRPSRAAIPVPRSLSTLNPAPHAPFLGPQGLRAFIVAQRKGRPYPQGYSVSLFQLVVPVTGDQSHPTDHYIEIIRQKGAQGRVVNILHQFVIKRVLLYPG